MEKGGMMGPRVGGESWFDLKAKFHKAVFDFALGGKPVIFSSDATRLIEIGVAAVTVGGSGDALAFKGTLDEPLIVQAGINYFNLCMAVKARIEVQQSSSAQGDSFERFMLPSIQARFGNILSTQVVNSAVKGFSVSSRTAYGVLACDCKDSIDSTIAWVNRSTCVRFDGQVPPFCYPDDHFGPDVLFLLWNDSFEDFCPVLCQAKFKNKIGSQPDALQTIVPELLYHQRRGKRDQKRSTALNDVQWHAWERAQATLLGCNAGSNKRKREVVRFMVQYPAKSTSAARSGPVAFGEPTACISKKC
jgi:hypothetical protein